MPSDSDPEDTTQIMACDSEPEPATMHSTTLDMACDSEPVPATMPTTLDIMACDFETLPVPMATIDDELESVLSSTQIELSDDEFDIASPSADPSSSSCVIADPGSSRSSVIEGPAVLVEAHMISTTICTP